MRISVAKKKKKSGNTGGPLQQPCLLNALMQGTA
jgi:hypothetical protein